MKRNKRREILLTEEEAVDLKRKAQTVRMSESRLIRQLIKGYKPTEAPGGEFFTAMNKLAEHVDRLEKLSGRERDTEIRNLLFDECMNMKEFRLRLVKKYLTGKEE